MKAVLAIAAAVFVGGAAWAETENNMSSVWLEKSIDSTDDNNATISILSNVKFSDTIKTNKILLVGSLCGSHDLTPEVVRGTINALGRKGEVTWHLFARNEGQTATDTNGSRKMASEAGEDVLAEKGRTQTEWPYNDNDSLTTSRHLVLGNMLQCINENVQFTDEQPNYDYIVLEFDGSRIADRSDVSAALAEDVAEKMKWFYDNKRVIWIVDPRKVLTDYNSNANPYDGETEYYRPNSGFYWSSGGNHNLTMEQWESLVALLDPSCYLTNNVNSRYVATANWPGFAHGGSGDVNYGPESGELWAAGTGMKEFQANYSNLGPIETLIENTMKTPIYTAEAADTVASFGSALRIKDDSEISVYKWDGTSAPTNANPRGKWNVITTPEAEVSLVDHTVNVALSNLVNDTWYKLEIKVTAANDLVKEALNTEVEEEKGLCKLSDDGKSYEINPNKGDAKITLYRDAQDGKGRAFWNEASGAAINTWTINRIQGTGDVLSVTKVYDGVATNIVATKFKPELKDGDTIEYSCDAGAHWLTKNPSFKDVTPGQTSVWYRVKYADPLYINFTNTAGYVSITPRTVYLQAANANKMYDGKDLTKAEAKAMTFSEAQGKGYAGFEDAYGFVSGQGIASVTMTSDSKVKDVDEGTKQNVIETVTFKSGTKESNYDVEKFAGELYITPAPLTVTPNKNQWVCEGGEVNVEYSVSGFKNGETRASTFVSGSFGVESESLGDQKIVDNGSWSFGNNYTVNVDTKDRTFLIKECLCQQLYCAYAYRVKLAGKTVTGKELTKGTVGACDYESNCWAKPTSYRVAGYIFNASPTEPAECEECECNAFDNIQTVFWTADRKQAFADEEVTFDVFDVLRNGGFKNKAQLCIKIGENVKLAGFGAFNPKTRKLKSANGFFAGVLAAPTCGKLDENCEWGTTAAQVFAPCALTDPVNSEAAIVYGRWSMTYKADKVRQIEEDNTFDCLRPTGFDGVWPF